MAKAKKAQKPAGLQMAADDVAKPVETKPLRTKEQIDQDYANICAQIGDALVKRESYQTNVNAEFKRMNETLDSLRAKVNELDAELKAVLAAQKVS